MILLRKCLDSLRTSKTFVLPLFFCCLLSSVSVCVYKKSRVDNKSNDHTAPQDVSNGGEAMMMLLWPKMRRYCEQGTNSVEAHHNTHDH